MNEDRRCRWSIGCVLLAVFGVLSPACGGSGDASGDASFDGMEADGGDVPGDSADRDEAGDEPDAEPDAEPDGMDGEGRECASGGDCGDGNVCTLDECAGGYCRWTSALDGTACDDGLFCTLPGTCTDGACTGVVENDCDDDDDCTDDLCDDVMMECRQTLHPRPGEEGPLGDATCTDGVDNDCDRSTDASDTNCIPCESAFDCADGNECTLDTCDAGVCRNDPVADGTPCEDGQYCNVDEVCSAGACSGGAPRDCSGEMPVCNLGRCHEAEDRCFPEPVADGTSCSDGFYCTVGENCAGGVCGGGTPRDCSELSDRCNVGVCDDDTGSCLAQPVAGGTSCDDGSFCTAGDACTAGICGGGAPRDCSALTDACNAGTCDEAGDVCYAAPVADGTLCDDGVRCTGGEACAGGLCGGGGPLDCSAFNDACNTSACSEALGCHAESVADGTACSDGMFCTVGETCTAGACGGGGVRDCADADPCTTDSCSDAAGRCDNVLTPRPGDEGPFGSATCSNGTDDDCDRLTDMADPDCAECTADPECDDGDPCTIDRCGGARCEYSPAADGTPCSDGRYCTSPDTCTGGACGGPSRDCSAFTDSCNTGLCDEAGDRCYGDPLPNGTACNDGRYCTSPDTCTGGACGGPSRDCSAFTNQCNAGRCNEATDVCYGDPLPNGTACNDGQYCTTPDTCTGGACGGPSRDCSAFTNQCNTGRCNEATDACYSNPVADGTVCDADGNPATRDICMAGTCGFSACGDGYLDAAGGECCDDGNTLTESCLTPPAGSCIRDCSIRQDTCGNGVPDVATCEACDDGDTDSYDGCTTSCTVNDYGVGAPCTCTGGSCRMGNPTSGTISGCGGVVVPAGALPACFRSGTLGGSNLYFAAGFCSAYAHRCSPSLLCAFAGLPATVGSYTAFVGGCPPGSVFLQQTITSSGITLETKSCQKVCDSDSDCRWNEYDSRWGQCGHYECTAIPSIPGTRVCWDAQMTAP